MKRTVLERRSPLVAKTGLRRTAALNRSPLARSSLHAEGAARRQQPKRRTASPSPIPAKVRIALAARSGGMCEIASSGCTGVATDAAHRVRVGMGGRKGSTAVRHHVLSNLLHLDRHCHTRHGHANPAEAYPAGWMLRENQDPATTPALYRGVWVRLGDDGSMSPANTTAEEAPMTSDEDCMTIFDSAGRALVLERADDGAVGVWIADVGENDGVSVLLGEESRERVAKFLLGGRS